MTEGPTGASYPDLAGRRVLVTGGANGIGRHTTLAFCQQGARVTFVDTDVAAAEEVIAAAGQQNSPLPDFLPLDLCNVGEISESLQRHVGEQGVIDVLVNNAGWDPRQRFDEVTPEFWEKVMAINLRHFMFVSQAVTPGMVSSGGGAIVNLGSTSWMQGAAGLIAYTTAKSAILGFTRCLARELGGDGIRVNCVSPGRVAVDRIQDLLADPAWVAETKARQCLKEVIQPDDVAKLVLWLASCESRMCTGQNFIIDAGTV